MDVRAVRPGPVADRGGAAEQPAIKRRIVQLGRQRPAQPAFRRPLQIAIDRPHADRARLGHRLVGQSLLVSEPQYLANLPHLQPPCRHRLAPPEKGEACRGQATDDGVDASPRPAS